ncbi:MAG: DUF5103 domain-containing protein [Paludibacteraceae bacterium]|nr:DUF5103 domain-containing protein [Paludibacteraceae bacterium]
MMNDSMVRVVSCGRGVLLRGILLLCACLCLFPSRAQQFMNKAYTPDIKTLQVYLNSDQLDLPILRMGSSDHVTITFDWMSHKFPHLAYRVRYCNADWTLSDLEEMDYMEGLNEVILDDPGISMNTTFDYSHYEFSLPNDDVKLTLPGNYVVQVYDTESPSSTLLVACFSQQDPKVNVVGTVDGRSVYGVNKEYQHLSFEVFFQRDFTAMPDELTVVVRQNGRYDNEVYGLKPTYVKPESLVFEDERKLSFEGGVQYNVADFSHRFRYSGCIERIQFHNPYYHVEMRPGMLREGKTATFGNDVNGGYLVHQQDVWSDAEVDYSVVHFTYPVDEPWLDGALYVSGAFNDGRLNERNMMNYNYDRHQYVLDVVLKNGGYNFQYLFVPAGLTSGLNSRVEGSFWETENEYQVYVYYRSLGSDHDRLVGFERILSK